MHPKVSKWLAQSSKFLRSRITKDNIDNRQFEEELELRRTCIETSEMLFPSVTNESIQGVYQIVGANSENAEQGYFGTLTLKFSDNKIHATWLIEGEDIQSGYGILFNNILSIQFVYEQDKKEYFGVVSYEFISQSILSGVWIEEFSDETGVEFGRKLPVQTVDPLGYFGFN